MSEISVGKEILSICTKCHLSLAHLIMNLKENGTVGKVKCKTCGAVHSFKSPNKSSSSKKSPRHEHKEEINITQAWQDAMNKSTSKPQQYSLKNKFLLGDIIEHPVFGQGVVDHLIDNNKIKVLFRTDFKMLVHNISK